MLVEAITYRFRGHSMADPEEYRTKEQVEEWRKRDPIDDVRATRLVERGRARGGRARALDEEAVKRVDEAVAFADRSAFPPPESLYDDVYVLGDQVKGWYSVDERSAGVAPRRARARAGRQGARPRGGLRAGGRAVATREDVGLEKAADEAQAEDEEAESAEDREDE